MWVVDVTVLTAYLGTDHPHREPVQLLFGGHDMHEPGSAGRILAGKEK